jgi:hypothetical protein
MTMIGDLVARLRGDTSDFDTKLKHADSTLASFAKGVTGKLVGITAAFGAAFSAREILSGAGVLVSSAKEAVMAERKLGAVLAATGGAAGLSAQEIAEYAGELQRVTNFGDDATIAVAGVLATFKEVKGDQFKEALGFAQDMSAVLGNDVQANVLMLGKALNDPTQGITALTRAGVSFTQQQKDQIKALQRSGDLMGAQKIILAELKSEFGGAAEAMADPMVQAENAIGDLYETLGFALLPAVQELSRSLRDNALELTKAGEDFKRLGQDGEVAMRVLTNATSDFVSNAMTGWRIASTGAALYGDTLKELAIRSVGLVSGGVAESATRGLLESLKSSTERAREELEAEAAGRNAGAKPPPVVDDELVRRETTLQTVKRLMEQMKTPAEQLSAAMNKISFSRASGDISQELSKQLEEFERGKVSGIAQEIASARAEFERLTDSIGGSNAMMDRLKENGASLRQRIELGNLQAENEKFKERVSLQKEATRIIESIKTPRQAFDEQATKLKEMFRAGLLTREQFDLAGDAAIKDFSTAQKSLGETTENGPVAALKSGSGEAISAIQAAIRGGKDKDPNTDILKRQLTVQEKTAVAIETVAGRINNTEFEIVGI